MGFQKGHPNYFKGKGLNIKKICKFCCKEFEVYPSSKDRKYCSYECGHKITDKIFTENGKKTRWYKGIIHSFFERKDTIHSGYILTYLFNHPVDGSVIRRHYRLHRLIMEIKVGRRLFRSEDVHHINGIKTDNRIDNLQLLTHSEHTKLNNPVLIRWKGVVANAYHNNTTAEETAGILEHS